MPHTTTHSRHGFRIPGLSLAAGLVCLALLPASATAQSSAAEIVSEALKRHADRAEGIAGYTVMQEVMGRTVVARFEKETRDGFPVFVQVGSETAGGAAMETTAEETASAASGQPGEPPAMPQAPGETASPPQGAGTAGSSGVPLDAGDLKSRLLEAAAGAGLEAVAGEIAGASDGQVAGLLGALGQSLNQGVAGGGGDFKGALLDAATQVGMEGLTSALGDVAGPEAGQLASAFQQGALGTAVQQLGAIAAEKGVQTLMEKALPDLIGGVGLAGAAGGGLGRGLGPPGMPGGGAGPGPGPVSQGNPQGQLLSAAAHAGMGALLGAGMEAITGAGPGTPSAPGGDMDPLAMLRLLGEEARLAGTRTLDGREDWLLVVDDPMATRLGEAFQFQGEGGFAPEKLTVRVDRELYVPRQLSLEGQMTLQGAPRPMALRTRMEDYREVDGLLHPFRTVVVVEGMETMLSDEERAELKEAMEQMEQMERQLAQLPPQQRAMAERMMKQRMPQIQQQMETMAGAEPMEIVTEVRELRVERHDQAVIGGEG